jgi:hypothetical protein
MEGPFADDLVRLLLDVIKEAVKWAEGGAMCLIVKIAVTMESEGLLRQIDIVRILEYLGSGMDPKGRVRRAVMPDLMRLWQKWFRPDRKSEVRGYLTDISRILHASIVELWESGRNNPGDIAIWNEWPTFFGSLFPGEPAE